MRTVALTVLRIGFALQIGVGLSASVAYDGVLWAWHRRATARELLGVAELPADAAPFVLQLASMLGATIACWAVAMLALALGPLARGERWALATVAGSTALWFAVDTGLSLRHGAWTNAIFNVAAAATVFLPLGAVWASGPPGADGATAASPDLRSGGRGR